MALLYLLHRYDVSTVAVHCNYALRGKASDKDQELVEQICSHWGIDIASFKFDPNDRSSGNFQDWARQIRYDAYEGVRKDHGSEFILTAHHRDDQVETILQKILRGSGISAWQGMKIRNGVLFRPLLRLPKSEIMKFVEEFNVPYRIDRSNEESTYARNFIRNNWFPDLDKLFPGWKDNVTRLTDKAKEHEALCDEILGQIHAGKMKIDRNGFLELNSITAPAILLHFLKKEIGITDVSRSFLTDLEKLGDLDTGKKVSVSEKYSILRDRGYFVIQNEETGEKAPNEMVIFRREISSEPIRFDGFSISLETPPVAFSEKKLHLDVEAVTFPLKVRRWKPGDVLQPFGMDGSQLVSDHLTNRKIPAAVKEAARVLEDSAERIVAVLYPSFKERERAGTISEKVRCGDTTQTILTIETVFK